MTMPKPFDVFVCRGCLTPLVEGEEPTHTATCEILLSGEGGYFDWVLPMHDVKKYQEDIKAWARELAGKLKCEESFEGCETIAGLYRKQQAKTEYVWCGSCSVKKELLALAGEQK